MIYFREHILFFVFFWKMIMRALEYVDSKITHTLTVLETSRISWPTKSSQINAHKKYWFYSKLQVIPVE